MLRVIMLRRRLELLQTEETNLRATQSGFATREADLAAQVAAATTDEEVAAVEAAVSELETTQRTTAERLTAIREEIDSILTDIAAAEEAAAAATGGDGGAAGEEGRGRRSSGDHLRRCREFQRTGRMRYDNAGALVTRAAVATTSTGVVGPTGVSGINDPAGIAVSDFLDLIRITDATGMAAYKVAFLTEDAAAGTCTEGTAPAESEPKFDSVTLTPKLKGILAYISREIRKQSPLQYEAKVKESVTRALRRILSEMVVTGVLGSALNTKLSVTAASGAALFTPHLLSDIILAYGGDEGVDGTAVLVLPKADLKAFAAVRGTNEYLPVYSIIPDAANPSMGVIKDNNGLSCRYCLNKNVPALSTASLSTSETKGLLYGNPQCAEMALWGGVDVNVNEGYKFGEGLLTVMGEVTADAAVTTPNGFVVVCAKKAS